jgi:apolipoprotein N-acyltransferase
MKKKTPLIVGILLTSLSGFFFFLSFPDKPTPLLAFACLTPLGIALSDASPRAGLLYGFVYGFLMWLTAIWWLSNALFFYVELSWSAAWFWTFVGCAVSAVPYAAFGLCCGYFQWMDRPYGPLRYAVCLTVFITWYPYLFPGHHAHSLYPFPVMIQILDLGGVPLLLFIVNLVNFLIAGAIIDLRNHKNPSFNLIAMVMLLGLTAGYGLYRLNEFHKELEAGDIDESIRVVSVQPNFTIRRAGMPIIFDNHKVVNDKSTVLKLCKLAVERNPESQLIVLPELPTGTVCNPDSWIWPQIRALAKKSGIPFLVNCSAYDYYSKGDYNIAQLILKNGAFGSQYRKNILFPFGEYLPFEKMFPWMRKLFPRALNYIPGKDITILPLGDKERIIPTICYEVLFTDFIREFVNKRGDVIVNLVDDAWFGESDASAIHMALALYRTVEYRIPFVRVTNSGNGVFVQPTGEIVTGSRTPVFEESITSFPLYLTEKRSPYFYLGSAFIWLLTALFCLDAVFHIRKYFRK